MQEKKQVVQLEHDNFTMRYFETIEGSYPTSLIPREGSYSQGDKVSELSIMIIQILKK